MAPSVRASPTPTWSPSYTTKCFPCGILYCLTWLVSSLRTTTSIKPLGEVSKLTIPSNSEIIAGLWGRLASNNSAIRGKPPVISFVPPASRPILASTSPGSTSSPSSTIKIVSIGSGKLMPLALPLPAMLIRGLCFPPRLAVILRSITPVTLLRSSCKVIPSITSVNFTVPFVSARTGME